MFSLRIPQLSLIVCLLVPPVSAGPMGPVDPTARAVSVEIEGGFEKRDMEWELDGENRARNEIMYGYARLAYGVTKNAEVHLRLGLADLETRDLDDIRGNGSYAYHTGSAFAWGLGGGAVLFDRRVWNVALNANYLAHAGHEFDGGFLGDIDYEEANGGLQLQIPYHGTLPYLGVKYSWARNTYAAGATRRAGARDQSAKAVGVYAGFGFNLSPRISGYLEGRFADETSAGGGLRYTF
jgi:hypothetical protein